MAKILQMHAYVANKTTHENVEDLGTIMFGVCVDNGLSSVATSRFPADNYNFFTSAVDDGLAFGGTICTIAAKSTDIDFLKAYCPLLNIKEITTSQDLSTLELKLVNAEGEFATKELTVTGSNAGMIAYTSSGAQIGNVPLSFEVTSITSSNFTAGWLFVSDFTDPDGKFSVDQTFYGVSVQSNRYWSKAQLNISGTVKQGIVNFLNNISAYIPPSSDPYEGAGDSEPVAFPHGDFDYGSDPIGGADRYHIPTVSVVDTGFVTLYNPTIRELKALSSYLWSSTFDLDTFKKIFNNPMDLFIGLSMIPVRVPQGPSKEVGIGMIGSGVYMTTASAQFVLVNCGVCDVPNFSGGYLDYSPYTKVEIYLPYIGFRTLNADEVMGKTLYVQYKVDILSGACTCWIDVLTTIADGTTDLCTTYVFMGECAVSIPLASGDWTNLLNGIIGAAAAVGAGFAAGGAGGAIAGGVSAASSVAVNDSKIHVERSGAITSSAGLMAPQSPYLIISTPHIHKPAEVPYYTGYPAYFTASLGDLSGFTIIDNIHLSNVPATEPELEEIETLLKGGVIL